MIMIEAGTRPHKLTSIEASEHDFRRVVPIPLGADRLMDPAGVKLDRFPPSEVRG
jgi:hypothetical protein